MIEIIKTEATEITEMKETVTIEIVIVTLAAA